MHDDRVRLEQGIERILRERRDRRCGTTPETSPLGARTAVRIGLGSDASTITATDLLERPLRSARQGGNQQ
jgi:hypothetical protein